MATVAFIASTALFLLGWAVFLTVFLLAAHAVSALVRHAVRRKRLEMDRRDYEDYLVYGKLNCVGQRRQKAKKTESWRRKNGQ